MKLSTSLFTALGGAAFMCLFTGCSSVMCGSHQSVSINSRPTGAEVLVYNSDCHLVLKKTTPCVASLKRSTPDGEAGNYIVLVKKKGFAPVQVKLTGKVNDAYYLNVPLGVGLMVDSATGAKWTLVPGSVNADSVADASMFDKNDVMVTLKPRSATSPEGLAGFAKPERE